MKRLLTALALGLLATAAYAENVVSTITVMKDGQTVYQQTNGFAGMTKDEAAKLMASAAKQLDFASKQQDKGGPYTIVWKWNDEPAIETQGMKFGAVNATLRQGTKWLNSILDDSDKAEKAGKSKPWGK